MLLSHFPFLLSLVLTQLMTSSVYISLYTKLHVKEKNKMITLPLLKAECESSSLNQQSLEMTCVTLSREIFSL